MEPNFELRPYQKECIETVDNLPDGAKTVVCLATGLGKTVTAAGFKTKGRILWLSHRDELVRQPERYFRMNGLSYGIEKAGETADDDVTVVSASVQSLSRDKRLYKYSPDDFDLVICDEAQHAAAPTYKKILGYFKPRKLIGLTATPKRGDGVKLSDVFDDICFVRDLKWGIQNKYLCPIRAVRVSAEFDFKHIKTSMGDFVLSSMTDEMAESDDDIVVTRSYIEYSIPEHKKTLIYCPTIKICTLVYQTMLTTLNKEEGQRIAVLSDKTPPEERQNILKSYKSEDGINCIINCMILTEGTDLPKTSVIINNRPTANASLYQQIVGRGSRLAEGKEYCLIVDVVGKNAGSRNICTAPTLFGVDPEQLPEKTRAELENGDLLELTEAILDARSRASIALTLRKEMVDIFTGERINLINEHKQDGFQGIAKAYEKYIEPKNDDIDFGDIMVKIQPEEDKHYCIPATYNGNIYMSKPDMLGNVTLTVDIPAEENLDEETYDGISKPYPVDTALKMIDNILRYSVNNTYAIRWSKSARKSMDRSKASDKQLDYIYSLYRDCGVKGSQGTLSKLQASDLIDLYQDLKALKKKGRALEIEQMKGVTVTYDPENSNKTEERLQKEKNFKAILYYTLERRDEYEKQFNTEDNPDNNERYVKVNVNLDNLGLTDRYMSDKQKGFIKRLEKELEADHWISDLTVDKIAEQNMEYNMWQASVVIGAYLELKKILRPPEGKECRVKLCEMLKEATDMVKSPDCLDNPYVKCRYFICDEAPLFEEVEYEEPEVVEEPKEVTTVDTKKKRKKRGRKKWKK